MLCTGNYSRREFLIVEIESINDNRYEILNTYVNAISMEETLLKIEQIIKNGVPTQHVVINALKVNLMEKDVQLRQIINRCPLINADGASIVWAAKKLGIPLKERVTGIDLFQNLVAMADKKGYKIYLFGARDEVVKKVKNIFQSKYPNLQIVGYRNGYFTEEEEPKIVESIANSGADMLFVAFSSPKKEYWVNKYLEKLNTPFVMGVGGSFDVVAGLVKRAPLWMQKHGLEWFYRFIQEPRRMWKRYILGNIQFVVLTLKKKKELRKGDKKNG